MNLDPTEIGQLLIYLNLELYRRDQKIAALEQTVMNLMFPPDTTEIQRYQDEQLDKTFERAA